MVRHINTNILGYRAIRDKTVFINNMQLIDIEQICKILHLGDIHQHILLTVHHISRRTRTRQIIRVQIFVEQCQLHPVILQGMYHLVYFCLKCLILLVSHRMAVK